MRVLESSEMDSVSGGDLAGLAGSLVSAVCGALSKGIGGAVGCTVAGEATTQLLNSAGDWDGAGNPPGGGDYSNPGYKNG